MLQSRRHLSHCLTTASLHETVLEIRSPTRTQLQVNVIHVRFLQTCLRKRYVVGRHNLTQTSTQDSGPISATTSQLKQSDFRCRLARQLHTWTAPIWHRLGKVWHGRASGHRAIATKGSQPDANSLDPVAMTCISALSVTHVHTYNGGLGRRWPDM